MRKRRTFETYSGAAKRRNFSLVAVGPGVGFTEPLGHRHQQLVGQGRHLVDDTRELALAEDEDLHVVLGHDRCRPWAAVEEGELAEVLADAELGDLPLAAL